MVDNETNTLWRHQTGKGIGGELEGVELSQPIAYPYEPGGAYRFYYEDPDVWFPIFDTPDDFELKESVIGLNFDGESLAVGVDTLAEVGPHVVNVGKRSLALVPSDGGAFVYDVSESGVSPGAMDNSFGATSDELTGPDGAALLRIVVPQLFWFAWYGEHPETLVWTP